MRMKVSLNHGANHERNAPIIADNHLYFLFLPQIKQKAKTVVPGALCSGNRASHMPACQTKRKETLRSTGTWSRGTFGYICENAKNL